MGDIYGHVKQFISLLLLFAPILVAGQTSRTTSKEPTPPPIIILTTRHQANETRTNATTVIPEVENTSSPQGSTAISPVTTIVTTFETSSRYRLVNEPEKIIGIAIGVALLCILIILGGIAIQKHIRRQRIKKEESTPPKDFPNPVHMSTGEASV